MPRCAHCQSSSIKNGRHLHTIALRQWAAFPLPQLGKSHAEPLPGHGWMPKAGNHGGGDVWMPQVIDDTTGILYFGTGNPSPNFDNSRRPGCNPWVNATVAPNARTGKVIWGHSEVCKDVWDYDSDPMPM